jgi:hypothetical protein
LPSLSTVVTSIFPSSNASAVIVNGEIWVLFSTQIDEASLTTEGNFFVTGPESDTWSGPDLALWQTQVNGDVLASPGLDGIVPGTFRLERINLGDLNTYSGTDTAGAGNLFRTKAVFKPAKQLTPNTSYSVYLSGDQDSADEYKTGVKPQTVFDRIFSGSGASDVTFAGTYNGSASSETYNVSILTTGTKGVATFEWWLSSAPGTHYGPILTAPSVLLNNGVYVKFGGVGSYVLNDLFTCVVKKQDPYTGTYIWSFTTGSGSIQTIPDSTSTSIIGQSVPLTALTPGLQILNLTPVDRATNLPVSTKQIIVEFNNDIDTTTVTSDRIKIVGYPVDGDEIRLFEAREIFKDITVSGKKIIIDI